MLIFSGAGMQTRKHDFQIDISIQISLSNNEQFVKLEVPLASVLGSRQPFFCDHVIFMKRMTEFGKANDGKVLIPVIHLELFCFISLFLPYTCKFYRQAVLAAITFGISFCDKSI
jgi:hypothetical protein